MQNRVLKVTDRSMSFIEDALTILGIVLIAFIMLSVVVQVTGRYVFNWVQPAHIEIVELLMPGVTFFALAYTQRSGHQIRVDIVIEMFKGRRRRVLEVIALLLTVGCCIFLAYTSAVYALQAFKVHDTTTNTYIINWPSKTIVTVGFVFISIRGLIQIAQQLSTKTR